MMGYYWVRHYAGDDWEIAALSDDGEHYRMPENPYVLDREDFHEMGEKVRKPQSSGDEKPPIEAKEGDRYVLKTFVGEDETVYEIHDKRHKDENGFRVECSTTHESAAIFFLLSLNRPTDTVAYDCSSTCCPDGCVKPVAISRECAERSLTRASYDTATNHEDEAELTDALEVV